MDKENQTLFRGKLIAISFSLSCFAIILIGDMQIN